MCEPQGRRAPRGGVAKSADEADIRDRFPPGLKKTVSFSIKSRGGGMVYALSLSLSAERHAGSSPAPGIKINFLILRGTRKPERYFASKGEQNREAGSRKNFRKKILFVTESRPRHQNQFFDFVRDSNRLRASNESRWKPRRESERQKVRPWRALSGNHGQVKLLSWDSGSAREVPPRPLTLSFVIHTIDTPHVEQMFCMI